MDTLPTLLVPLGFALLGYLCGSLPFAIWITRLFKGVDVREAGSGHATTTTRFARSAQQLGRGLASPATVKPSRLAVHLLWTMGRLAV